MAFNFDLPNGWRLMPLPDCVYFQEGPGLRNWQYRDTGVPFVNIRCIKDGRLLRDEMTCLDPAEVEGKYQHFLLDPGDYVVSSSGTLGRLAEVRAADLPCMLNTSVIRFRPLSAGVIERRFLRYFLASSFFYEQILAHANGSAQLNYGPSHLKKMHIVVPPKGEQNGIGELLGLLDDRIDLLRQANATLESIAQALFKSWFIDFDPVRAKAEGREPEGMDAATAALFPAEFEESALGLIPKGWGATPFAETVNILGGGTPKTSVPEYWGGEIPWFSVVDAPGSGQVFTLRTEKSITTAGVDNSSTRVLPAWTTIISARGTVGKLAMTACPMAMNQSCYGLCPKVPGTEPLVYLAAQRLVDDLKRLAHGGVFDTITRDTLSSVGVVEAPTNVQANFAEMVKPVFVQIQLGVQRVSTLTELRDALLPRLISGKLRLPEAQALIDEVAA